MPGKVTLVGAGPGDPGLLTRKGLEALQKAEVVVYDRLVSPAILAMMPEKAEHIDVGKQASRHPVPQDQINQILLDKAVEGKNVVRLKGGDPFLFGRGGEELELLARHRIPFEEVPGITSAIAAPAYGGIPVTHRDFTSSLHIITGHARAGKALDIDFEALKERDADVPELVDMHDYFSKVKPTAKNEWTGRFQGKNLIWIVAEAFSGQMLDPERTPTLWKLSHEGIICDNFYTPLWGVSTSDGEYVTTTGLIPKPGVWSYSESSDNDMPFGFGNQFQKLGYRTLAYHDYLYTYYDRNLSHPNMGYDYYAVGHGLEISDTWPESDLEMMEASIPRYIDEEQFLTYYMTVSGHLDYGFSTNDMAAKNKAVVEDLPYSGEAQAYLATQVELDRALAYLIEELEKAGKLEDTVIVLSGDHYPYGLSQDAFDELAGHEVDQTFELYKSQLILWCADMEEPVEVDKFCSSLDIMPTLANLFGLPYDSRLVMGRDILSDSPGLVMFSNYSFLTDLGAYDAVTDTFTPWEGVEAPEDYAAQVLEQVQGKFDFSRLILEEDYYRVIFGEKTPWDFLPEEDLPEKNASYGPTAAIR